MAVYTRNSILKRHKKQTDRSLTQLSLSLPCTHIFSNYKKVAFIIKSLVRILRFSTHSYHPQTKYVYPKNNLYWRTTGNFSAAASPNKINRGCNREETREKTRLRVSLLCGTFRNNVVVAYCVVMPTSANVSEMKASSWVPAFITVQRFF